MNIYINNKFNKNIIMATNQIKQQQKKNKRFKHELDNIDINELSNYGICQVAKLRAGYFLDTYKYIDHNYDFSTHIELIAIFKREKKLDKTRDKCVKVCHGMDTLFERIVNTIYDNI